MGLKHWFRKPASDDAREEIEAHLAMRADHDGSDAASARRRFGNVLQTEESMRRVWIAAFLDTVAQDAFYTWRSWRRNPAFAVTGVLVLALGLGAATAMFSALDRILFRPLPYPDAGQLVSFGYQLPRPDGTPGPELMPDKAYFGHWQPLPEHFSSVSVSPIGTGPCDVVEERPERLLCTSVDHTFLRTLGLRVALGRDFTPEEDTRGAPRAILLTHKLWMRRFGGDPRAVGRTLNLDGRPGSIIGVLPENFESPLGAPDLLYPAQLTPMDPSANFTRYLIGIGRLKSGVTPQRAQGALQGKMAQLLSANRLNRLPAGAPFIVRPLQERLMGDSARTAWLLLGAVGGLLLIACVNVTSLMLARVTARQREFAVRSALGAGKLRLARLAVTESLLLAFTAGTLGLGIAGALIKLFVEMAPATIPKIDQAGLDLRVFWTAALLSAITGVLAGCWPAISILRANEIHGLRTTGGVKPRIRFALVTVQIALTVAMLSGSTLMLRSLWNMANIPLGFESEHVLTMRLMLNVARYPTEDRQSAFFNQLLEHVQESPGTVAAALSNAPPPMGISMAMNLAAEGRDNKASGVLVRAITPRYFDALRIPIVAGRSFVPEDKQGTQPVAVINASLARALFGTESAMGQRLRPSASAPWQTVIGVVQDTRNNGLLRNPQAELFLLKSPEGVGRDSNLVIRTSLTSAAAQSSLKQAVADLDPQLPVTIQTMDEQVEALTERPRFVAWLLASFAGIALFLAAAGLYGVATYVVTQRSRDIGVRMTLGATSAVIAKEVLSEAGRWILAGTALGCVLAWVAIRAIVSQLYGVTSADPLSWAVCLASLGTALLIAVSRPALRAARVNPVVALRAE